MNWDRIAADYLAVADEVIGRLRPAVEALADELAARIRAGGKVMACGNGGSAADAQHFAAELVNRFLQDRRPYAGLALSTDTSILTCIGNDHAFDLVFEKQVRALGKPGDALLAISTSGNAANVLRAVAAAREMGILTIGLTGGLGGRLAGAVDRLLCVGATAQTPRIQEGHALIIHALCERIEEILQ
jgi:D-sedoheptulose 7-phosphate isomerase